MRRASLLVVAAVVLTSSALVVHARQVNPSYFGDLKWRSIGPSRSGYVSSPAGVPGDPTTYYAGMPEGGVWKTTNGGTTWKPIFDDVHVPSVGAVAVAPSNPSVVYVGTGNQSGWSFTPGKGVFKSTDAGATWTNVGLRDSQYIGGIAVDPRNADAAIVAVQGGRAGGPGRGANAQAADARAAGERGVYRTTDGGRSWARVLPADGSAGASDVYLDYGDPEIVYALLNGGGGGPQAAPSTGVYKSTDAGATWAPISSRGLPDGARISAFAVASGTHGKRLYAVAAAGGGRGGPSTGSGQAPSTSSGQAAVRALYRSDDGGESWVFGTRELASAGGKIYADPQHPDVMYLMGTAVYRSTDAGRHVAAFWGAPSGADPRFLWIDPTNSKRLLAGVDQGAAISVDAGESWTPYYGIVNGQFYRVATDYDTPYHVCGPQQDSGTACVPSRTDFGELRSGDWYAGGGFENGFLIADPADRRYMYTQGWYHVLRRFDRTTSQVVVLYQPTPTDRFASAPPLAFSPQDPRTLYMAAQYVMASSDHGETWHAISPDLTGPEGTPPANPPPPTGSGRAAQAPGGSIQALAPSPVAPGQIWIGTSTGRVELTRDAGKTWVSTPLPNLPPGAVNVIDASHKKAGTAYVALLSRDGHPHIYRTDDFGARWQEISTGLADGEAVRVVREDPRDEDLLYAGTVTSAYVSFDRGDHWQSLQLNLPNTVVSDMTVKDNDLVISTYGRGFWILDDVTPLRQVRAAMATTAPAFFYEPAPASRMRWDNTQDTPVPPEMKVGDNPPEGAVFDYYLPSPVSGPVTLTITGASGAVIREFSNTAPPPDTTMPNVPEYWIMPPTVLATTAGMHRVSWDLRYPDPPSLNYSYYGNALDYREYTLNWHALPGKTYRSTIVGPMVAPGTYTATLKVNGRGFTQRVTVVPDPRVPVSQAALVAQLQLQRRMVAGLTTTYDAVRYLESLDTALADRAKGAAGKPGAAEIAAAIPKLTAAAAALDTGPDGFGIPHRDLGRRLNDQVVGDQAPTPNIVDGVDAPCRAIDAASRSLEALQTSQIAPLNAMLTKAGLGALPSWTPPASGCAVK